MKIWAVLVVIASLLFVAPVIESATSATTEVFQTFGSACAGGG